MKYTNDLRAVTDIVNNLNRSDKEKYFVDKCEKIFIALESIFGLYIEHAINNNELTAWAQRQLDSQKLSINNKFSETVSSILTAFQKNSLIESKEFKEIIHYYPLIMSDFILESARYNPDSISIELLEKATRTHKKLIDLYNEPRRNSGVLITSLCKLLYEVRSNMKHCGKTPYGPDVDKSKRDEEICKLIHPTLIHIIDILLEEPNSKLLIYGTLKLGQANASLIDNLRKNTSQVSIWGFIEIENILPYYTFSISNSQKEINAELIVNKDFKNNFEKLDQFEGINYRRIKVPYKYGEDISIANIYERNNEQL